MAAEHCVLRGGEAAGLWGKNVPNNCGSPLAFWRDRTYNGVQNGMIRRRFSAMETEVSNLFVCLMGMGVTFVGLICLIFLSQIMGALCQRFRKAEPVKAAEAPVPQPAVQEIPNRGAMVAAVSAALAEELGTSVSAIRILSFRKVG